MEPGGSMPHSQGLSNNSYPESNQSNYPHLHTVYKNNDNNNNNNDNNNNNNNNNNNYKHFAY